MNRTVRVTIVLALPVTILLFFVLFTIIQSRVHSTDLCHTWMGSVLPFCT